MNEADVLATLRAHWMDSRLLAPEPYVWEDETDPPTGDVWMRVTLRSASSRRPAIGRVREDNMGVILVQTFSNRELGPGPGERLASDVAAIWRAFRHPQIRLQAPDIAGLPADGAFNRQLVTVDWRANLRFTQALGELT